MAAGRLESELDRAGVCVARARAALRDLDWQPPADKASRAEDLQIIGRARTREARWSSIRKGLGVVLASTCALLLGVVSSR